MVKFWLSALGGQFIPREAEEYGQITFIDIEYQTYRSLLRFNIRNLRKDSHYLIVSEIKQGAENIDTRIQFKNRQDY